MKKHLLIFILSVVSFGMSAQDFKVPVDYNFEKPEDYGFYEKDVINCINWLFKTPLNEAKEKRANANRFLLKWIMGSPSVAIELNANILTFMSSSPDLLIIFFGGWTKYVLESKDDDKLEGNLAGLNATIDFYVKNKKHMKKDKELEKLFKMKEKETLREFVRKKLN